jgi:hypothetical protein
MGMSCSRSDWHSVHSTEPAVLIVVNSDRFQFLVYLLTLSEQPVLFSAKWEDDSELKFGNNMN